jgi:hypothetical protein
MCFVRLTAEEGSDATDSGVGRLEAYADAQRGWGTVCATRFSVEDAIVACRQMGQSGSTPAFWTRPCARRTRQVPFGGHEVLHVRLLYKSSARSVTLYACCAVHDRTIAHHSSTIAPMI